MKLNRPRGLKGLHCITRQGIQDISLEDQHCKNGFKKTLKGNSERWTPLCSSIRGASCESPLAGREGSACPSAQATSSPLVRKLHV